MEGGGNGKEGISGQRSRFCAHKHHSGCLEVKKTAFMRLYKFIFCRHSKEVYLYNPGGLGE